MRITVDKISLEKALSVVAPAVSKKAVIPITSCVKLDFNQNILTVTGTDIENTISSPLYFESAYTEYKSVCIEFKDLFNIVKLISDLKLDLSFDDEKCILHSWNGDVVLPVINAEDFPLVPDLDKKFHTLKISYSTLVDALNKELIHVSKDELRPIMCSYCLEGKDNEINIVSIDGHSLGIVEAEYTGEDNKVIISPSILRLLKGLNIEGDITINYDSKHIEIDTSLGLIYSRCIEGTYPNYKAIVPSIDGDNYIVIDADILNNTIKSATVCASSTSNLISFDIRGTQLTITARDIDFQKLATFKLAIANVSGLELNIGFNSAKLIPILDAYEGEIRLYLSVANKPAVFVDEIKVYRQLLMPLTIKK